MARQACRPGELVVVPESAFWPWSLQRTPALADDLADLRAGGCDVLLGSPRWQDDRVFNSVFLLDDDGRHHYDKRRLVPFGEYVPFRDLLPFAGTLARNAGDFSAGEAHDPLPWGEHAIGLAVCFEVIFQNEMAATVAAGADLLVSITNDAWYGDSWAPWQHLRAARFRAAENARPLYRAALTGVSAVISPDGHVVDQIGVGERGTLRVEASPRDATTVFTRAPRAVPIACLVLAPLAIFSPRPRRRRGSLPQP